MWKAKFVIILMVFLMAYVPVLADVSLDHREPTVTREEAELINQAVTFSQNDITKAIDYLKPSVLSSSSAAMDFALGNLYFQNNQFQEAVSAYGKAIKKMPEFDRARANLARIYIQQDKPDMAFKELKFILDAGTEKASVLVLAGYIYLLNDQSIPAESAYRKALLSEPDNEQAYLGLAKALLLQQRYSEAERLFKEYLEKNPHKGEIWVHLANTQLAASNTDAAIVSLESARMMRLLRSDSLATLGDLYLNRNQADEALIRYQEAFAHEYKSVARILRAIEGFLMTGRNDHAGILITDAGKSNLKDGFKPDEKKKLNWFSARHSHLSGKYNEAERQYREILNNDPLNGEILMAMGEIYQLQAQYELAALQYERASRIEKNKVEALIKHAQLEVKREKYQKAVALLEEALTLEPSASLERYLKQIQYMQR